MTTITIKVEDKKQARMLCEMLSTMSFVKEVGLEEDAEELKVLEERMAGYIKKTASGIPWEKVKAELGKKYGK